MTNIQILNKQKFPALPMAWGHSQWTSPLPTQKSVTRRADTHYRFKCRTWKNLDKGK